MRLLDLSVALAAVAATATAGSTPALREKEPRVDRRAGRGGSPLATPISE